MKSFLSLFVFVLSTSALAENGADYCSEEAVSYLENMYAHSAYSYSSVGYPTLTADDGTYYTFRIEVRSDAKGTTQFDRWSIMTEFQGDRCEVVSPTLVESDSVAL